VRFQLDFSIIPRAFRLARFTSHRLIGKDADPELPLLKQAKSEFKSLVGSFKSSLPVLFSHDRDLCIRPEFLIVPIVLLYIFIVVLK
jgi:hypothetical protein